MATGHVQEENFSVCFSLLQLLNFWTPSLWMGRDGKPSLHTTISLRNNMTISEDDRISDKSFPGPAPTSQSPPPETNCVPFHDLIPWSDQRQFIPSSQTSWLRYCVSMCYALPHSTLFIKLIVLRDLLQSLRRALWTITFSTFKSGQESFQCQLYWTKDWALPLNYSRFTTGSK